MKPLLFPLVLAALLQATAYSQESAPDAQDIPDEIVKKVDPSVVAIQHEKAGGSGFVITPDGYILTNGHVIRGEDDEDPTKPAKSITVVLNDERKFPAKVIGFSLNPDVALIKIEAPQSLLPVQIGDSRHVQIGQRCFAVGMPLGLKRTFTRGILSNVERTDLGTETKVFQTDAAINPGNSGGPLFDGNGRVLGLNTYGNSGANNLGFTIPIHVAMVLKDHYLAKGRFARADLPTYFTSELYAELARALDVEKGVLVTAVMPDSSAYKAGLREGDIIVETDGKPSAAHTRADLLDYNWELETRAAGSDITFTVLRGPANARQKLNISAKLEPMDLIPKGGLNAGEIPELRYDALGLGIRQIVTLDRIQANLPEANGVLVSSVRPSEPADKAELRERDVITHVADKPTPDMASFQRELEAQLALRAAAIPVTVARGRATITTAIAPFYGLREKTKVALIVPASQGEYEDLLKRELIASGAVLTVTAPTAELKASDFDVLVFAGGAGSRPFRTDENALRLVKEAAADKKTIAAVGSSVMVLANAIPDIKGRKLTTVQEDSTEVIAKRANYTGKTVESDGNLVTTTGVDRAAVRAFLKALYRTAREKS